MALGDLIERLKRAKLPVSEPAVKSAQSEPLPSQKSTVKNN